MPLLNHFDIPGKRAKKPDHYGTYQDHSTHFAQKNLTAVPHVNQQTPECWHSIGRQFHHKGGTLAPEKRYAKQFAHGNGQGDTQPVNAEHDIASTGTKKGASQQHIHW